MKKPEVLPPLIAGEVFEDRHGKYRVMAVAENYAMCRRKGCIPFVVPVKTLVASREAALAAVEVSR